MQAKKSKRSLAAKALVFLMAIAMVFTMMPLDTSSRAYAASELQTKTPTLVVTGQELLTNGAYSAANVGKEKSYTMDELKNLGSGSVVTNQMYTSKKQKDPFTKSYYMASGVRIDALVSGLADVGTNVTISSSDGYKALFNETAAYTNDGSTTVKPGLSGNRYMYDGFEASNKTEVPSILMWAYKYTEGSNGLPPTEKPTSASDKDFLTLCVGQYDDPTGGPEDMNNPLFNKNVNRIQVGDAIDEVVLTVGTKEYTRADILLMNFAERTYNYSSSAGDQSDLARGVPMSELLKGEDGDSTVSFTAADGYDMSSASKTVNQLIEGNYMLAYEVNGEAVYSTAKKDASKYGFLTLYGDGEKPSKMINGMSVEASGGIDFAKSPFKHITNGGQEGYTPYNIDSITGATLTVEGPGVKSSVPLSVKDLENRTAGCARGVYSDTRDGQTVTRTYEGIDLYHLLKNMASGSSGIILTDKAYQVKIKNRNRNTISTFTMDEIEQAHNDNTPILISYGTANEDGTNPRPYVFTGATGEDESLGNGDGCLKLVYDTSKYGNNSAYTKFGNMAYVYVEEQNTPGFKHTTGGDTYNVVDDTEYIISVTGDTLGREVNYTLADIEGMVEYDGDENVVDNAFGYRDNYSLTNTTYWYVNEYEGVKLWSLLLHSGLDSSLSTDNDTKINYITSDNYGGTDKFTIKQVADPDSFGFYEKNALDNNDGTYVPNENLRVNNDPATGDKLAVGYPVLLAYGMNSYPYVSSSKLPGYISGLTNDGGPVRVISGKTNYKHNNGSSQAQKLSGIVVGSNNYHYASHKYSDKEIFTALADNELTVNINTSKGTNTQKYKIGDLEDIVYDGTLSPTKLKEAKVKAKYNTGKYSDLYEGVNLSYFLKDVVELSGSEGTVKFTDSTGDNSVEVSLGDILDRDNGYNPDTKVENLVPVLAYGKNGYPMVNKTTTPDGFVSTEKLAEGTPYEQTLTVKNQNGPLQFINPAAKDGSIAVSTLTDVTQIDINLTTDKYSHSDSPYDAYADNTLTVSGEGTNLTAEKTFTVAELEGKQTLAGTYDYSFRNSSGTVNTQRYRGINLYKFLKSSNVGLKSNADKVIIRTTDGSEKEFSMADIIKTDYINTEDSSVTELPVILAFGSAATTNTDRKDGKALVAKNTSDGYDAAYGNDGGPLKLVIGAKDADDANKTVCMKNVASIEVTASAITNWNHSSSSTFASYLDREVTFEAVDGDNNVIKTKTCTVKELEDMTELVDRATLHLETDNEWEGLNFWQLVSEQLKDVNGIDNPTSINVVAADGWSYNVLEQGLDALKNGVKDGSSYYPILLAYGMDGTPLAQFGKNDPEGPGYDSTKGNGNGPFRLVIHNANGKSAGNVVKVQVKVSGGDTPTEPAAFTVKSNTLDKPAELSIDDLKKLAVTEKEYNTKGNVKVNARGVLLSDLFASLNITDEEATFTIDAGGYDGKGTYTNISLAEAAADSYLVAYEVYDADSSKWVEINDTEKTPNSTVRIYRNYIESHGGDPETQWYNTCQYISGVTATVPERTVFTEYVGTGEAGQLPMAGIRSTSSDYNGNLYVGTNGGGVAVHKLGSSVPFDRITAETTPALLTSFATAVAADDNGGVWISQNASYTDTSKNRGLLYMKDGEVTSYREADTPKSIPNDYVQAIKIDGSGNVWIGSFGGLTKYNPNKGTWESWDKNGENGSTKVDFPAESVSSIEIDKNGGLWVGFYPDSTASDGSAPFTGGFAYFKDGKVIKKYEYTSAKDSTTGQYRLGDVWVRDIAVDKNGNAWIVASGSYADMNNVGGKVWFASAAGGDAAVYNGRDLVGEETLSGATNSELRAVTVDPDGGLWFGTSADGIIYAEDAAVKDGKLTVTEQFSQKSKSWQTKNMNNVFSLDIYGKTLYSGTAAGIAVHTFPFENSNGKVNPSSGDMDNCDLQIIGKGVKTNTYLTIKELKNHEGITAQTKTYHWMNRSGTEGDTAFEGAYVEDILGNIAGLEDNATKVIAYAADNRAVELSLDTIKAEDLQGNKPMLAWKQDGEKCNLQLVIGQYEADENNKTKWNSNVTKLVVYASAEDTGSVSDAIEAINLIGDDITLDSRAAIEAARNLYDSLTDVQKAKVTNYDRLVAAEKKLDVLKLEKLKADSEEFVYSIDYDKYTAKNMVSLWIKGEICLKKIAAAETSEEAAKYFDEYKALLSSTPTIVETQIKTWKAKKPAIAKVTAGKKSVTVQWNKVSSAAGYKIYRATAKNGKYTCVKTVKNGKTVKWTNKNLKGHKKYYYKIRAYKKIDGKIYYTKYSAVKSIKTK